MTDHYDETAREIVAKLGWPMSPGLHDIDTTIAILRERFPEPLAIPCIYDEDAPCPGYAACTSELKHQAEGDCALKPKSATQDARELVDKIRAGMCIEFAPELSDDQAVALIEAHDARLLDEAADRAVGWLHEWIDEQSDYEGAKSELRAAIGKGEV